MRRLLLLLAAILCLIIPARADDPSKFEWKDGDRVVLIGDALIERDQTYSYLETYITLWNPDKSITFRDLGWSGDTVYGVARAGFGKPAEGYRHLVEHVLALKPTVIIVGYGMTDSFEGEAGLPRFKEGMFGLLDALAVTKARLVLLSPIAHEDLGRPLPDPSEHNRYLRLYRDALRDIAKQRGAAFADLFEPFEVHSASRRLDPAQKDVIVSDDGIHLNEMGYCLLSYYVYQEISQHLFELVMFDAAGKFRPRPVRGARFGPGGMLLESQNTSVAKVAALPRGLRFELTTRFLPLPLPPDTRVGPASLELAFDDLPDGRYTLSIDGRLVAKGNAGEWKKGVACAPGPEDKQVEQLRQTLIAKNRLYFYRWRPQNETYLFGFRKHEQGNNAREVPLFDPLVEEKEQEIARLKVPVKHVYELIREGEESK